MNMPVELRQAIEAAHGGPIEVADGERRYVLLRAEDYERLKHAMDEGTKFAVREMGRRAGWDDPAMDAYDALDPRRE